MWMAFALSACNALETFPLNLRPRVIGSTGSHITQLRNPSKRNILVPNEVKVQGDHYVYHHFKINDVIQEKQPFGLISFGFTAKSLASVLFLIIPDLEEVVIGWSTENIHVGKVGIILKDIEISEQQQFEMENYRLIGSILTYATLKEDAFLDFAQQQKLIGGK
jgi:hypothetical protein